MKKTTIFALQAFRNIRRFGISAEFNDPGVYNEIDCAMTNLASLIEVNEGINLAEHGFLDGYYEEAKRQGLVL